MERVNFRVYNAHFVTREARRVRALLCYLSLSPTSFLSPCQLFQQCLMEKRRWLKVQGGKRRWKVEEAAVCKTAVDEEKPQHKYRIKLWGYMTGKWLPFPTMWPSSEQHPLSDMWWLSSTVNHLSNTFLTSVRIHFISPTHIPFQEDGGCNLLFEYKEL